MPNTLGTLVGTLILTRALELVFTKRPILKNISLGLTDLDGKAEALVLGQTAITRVKSIPAVTDFDSNAEGFVTTDVPVVLSEEKKLHLTFTREELNSTNRDLIEEAAEPIAVGIANHFVDEIAELWTPANFPNETVVGSGWTYSNTLLALRAALNGRGVSEMRRFLVHSTGVGTALLGDSMVVAALNNPANGNAIERGELPRVAGFGLEEYPAIPSDDNLVGFAGTPDSTILAVRPHKNPEDAIGGLRFPGNFGYITEPKSGLTLAVSQWIDANSLDVNTRLSWLQGKAKGDGARGQRLVTAATGSSS